MELSKTTIIAGDAEAAELVCSLIRKSRIYLPVIEAPPVRLEKYGIFDADCVRITNAVKALNPETLLFVKVSPEVSTKLISHLKNIKPIIIEDFDEELLAQHVSFNQSKIGFHNLLLQDPSSWSSDLFVVEGEFSFSHVIAANLAIAHGGRIIPIAQVSAEQVSTLKEKSRTWSNGSFSEREQARDSIFEFAGKRLPDWILNSKASSVSFISLGVPYGVLPFRCPTTHYFSFPFLGLSVLMGMFKCQSRARCPLAILIDPNTVGQSEFWTLHETLVKAGYLVRRAYGESATIREATYLCIYLPCDFIFFSTHCGELAGHRIIERFRNQQDEFHEICYDRTISIHNIPGTEEFQATCLYVPISIDKVDWSDDEAKATIKAGELLEDFLQLKKDTLDTKDRSEIISIEKNNKISGFEGLRMSDGNYFPIPDMVGGGYYPVVFNNACCSWRTLAINFGCCGASNYVGTVTDVLNSMAVSVASSFVKLVTSDKSIGTALFRSQKQFVEQLGYTPYLMHGYLYTKLANPSLEMRSGVAWKVQDSINAIERISNPKRKIGPLNYIKRELAFISKKINRKN